MTARSGIAASLGSLKTLREERAAGARVAEFPGAANGQALKSLDAQTPKRLDAQPLPLQGTAKSKHPQWEKKTIYIRTATRRLAERKWEDEGEGDFSDLVEKLLSEYGKGGK